jgi:hypothetical protein
MSPVLRYFVWNYLRALVWVAAVSWALHRGTRSAKVSKAFIGAHILALGAGAALDFFLVNDAPRSWLVIDVMQWVFTAPIVIFTIISLYIGNWEKPIKIPDVFMTLIPIVMWGLMVVYGWQRMWDCHVLGAWFVSAASGGADLYARGGPAWARRNTWLTRLAGYVLVVAAVYLLLPLTEPAPR